MEGHVNFRRALPVAVLLLAVVVTYSVLAGSVLADTIKTGSVYNSPNLCVGLWSSIDHIRPDAPYSSNTAASQGMANDSGSCATTFAGVWAATRLDVYKASPGQPGALCRGTDWQYAFTSLTGSGPFIIFDYGGSASCGPGWYGTMGGMFVWDGSAWRGGWIFSGWDWVD
jgi:hypothetical protein